MKKKRGFTLIELLAVIVILAIIALIAVPVILSILDKSNKSAFKDTAYGIVNAGELYFAEQQLELNGVSEDKTFDLSEVNQEGSLQIKGQVPSGKVSVSAEGKVAISAYSDRYYAKKDYDNADVEVYEIMYYSTLRKAVNDVNNNEIGANADGIKETAEAGVYINNKNEVSVVLLKSVTLYPGEELGPEEDSRLTLSEDMTFNLNGNILTFENTIVGIETVKNNTNTIIIDGRLDGSGVVLNGVNGITRMIQTRTNHIIINGGNYIVNNHVFGGNGQGSVVISVGIGGTSTIYNSNIIAYSNYTVSETGKYDSLSEAILNHGTLIIYNSYVMGTHAGISNFGNLYINGGTYEGYGHGGIYFTGAKTTSSVKNAILRECDMPEGYEYSTDLDYNAGVSIGGNANANNITIEMDNCEIYGSSHPIVLRGSSGEKNNTLSISNSNIFGGKIRLDGGEHTINIGVGNNFDETDVNFTAVQSDKPSSVNYPTNKIYARENIENK